MADSGQALVLDFGGVISRTLFETHALNDIGEFDVDLVDKQESYRESNSMYPGKDVVTVDTPAGRVGLTICYDLRFPEMFRKLVDDGATMFTVPAAFTATTGRAHWHTLLRARAIENLCYVSPLTPHYYQLHIRYGIDFCP